MSSTYDVRCSRRMDFVDGKSGVSLEGGRRGLDVSEGRSGDHDPSTGSSRNHVERGLDDRQVNNMYKARPQSAQRNHVASTLCP